MSLKEVNNLLPQRFNRSSRKDFALVFWQKEKW